MRGQNIVIAVSLWFVCADSRKIKGVSLSYKRFYKERQSFVCIDGSKMIPFELVNDDYCDCDDGSDEPGTAACPNGRFYCTNLGFRPHYIPSSRVNDGICDCCDASDEYNSHVRCQNSCRNLGQKERADVQGQMKTLDDGLRLKQQLIEEGVLLWREKQDQLRDLEQVAEDLQVQVEEHRRRKQEADRIVASTAQDNGIRLPNATTDASIFHELDSNRDGSITVDEVLAKVVFSLDEDRVLSEDEALIKGTERREPHGLLDEDHIKAAKSAAEREAAELKKVEEAYETANAEISDLRRRLNIDYGPDWEFLFLSSQCYHLKVYEYTYTLCPFNQVTQQSDSGTEVSLGLWSTWVGTAGNLYCQMKYDSGEPCWQGPARTTVVTLTCGTETGLRSVKEPSKCQYVMDFQTPVACQPAPKQQQGIHNEL